MTAHVGGTGAGGNIASQVVTYTGTAGNLLIVSVMANASTGFLSLTGVTDSSGSNTWHYTAPSWAYDPGTGDYLLNTVAWSLLTAGVTAVTATLSGTADQWGWVSADEFSGVPAGYLPQVVVDTTDYAAAATWTSQTIQAPAGAPLIVTAGSFSGFATATTAGFTLQATGVFGAWGIAATAGAKSCAFTQTSGVVAGGVVFAMGTLVAVTTQMVPNAWTSVPYTAALAATGGTGSYTWTVTTGSLPTGLSISGSTITGTPTVSGPVSFTVTATDAQGNTATQALYIDVILPAGASLSDAVPGQAQPGFIPGRPLISSAAAAAAGLAAAAAAAKGAAAAAALTAAAGLVTGTGAAQPAGASATAAAPAAAATGAGAAQPAAVSTSSAVTATAGLAAGTGTAQQGAGTVLAYRAVPAVQAAGATVTKQAGTVAGDLILIFVVEVGDVSKTISCPGFASQVTASTIDSVALLARTADGSEAATFTLATTGTTANLRSVIITISGGAVPGPSSAYDSATAVTTIPLPGITIAAAGSWTIWMCRVASASPAPPGGYATQLNTGSYLVADNEAVSAGATGTLTGTCTSSDAEGALISIAPGVTATATAGLAAGTGAAQAAAAVTVTVNAAAVTGTGAAQPPAVVIGAQAAAAAATGTGAAQPAGAAVTAPAALATGTGTAETTAFTAASAGLASGTGAAEAAAAAYLPSLQSVLAQAATMRVDIPIVGDSVTEGHGASVFASRGWSDVNSKVRAMYPGGAAGTGGGLGYINIQNTGTFSYTWPVTNASGSPGNSDSDNGPVRTGVLLTQACTYTWTAPAGTTSVRIMWDNLGSGTAGSFTYKVGSGGTTTVSNSGTATLGVLTGAITITSGQVLTIAWVSGTCSPDGLVHYAGDEASGLTFHAFGRCSWDASTSSPGGWRQSGEDFRISQSGLEANGFFGIFLGLNDCNALQMDGGFTPTQYQANLTALASYIRSNAAFASMWCLLVIPYAPIADGSNLSFKSGTWAGYHTAALAAAAAIPNCQVVDLTTDGMPQPTSSGGDTNFYDGVHPNDTGYNLLAGYVAGLLTPSTAHPAGLATGTGAALAAGMAQAGLASGAGAATANPAQPAAAVSAGLATAAGAAPAPAMAQAGAASGTGAAQPAVPVLAAFAPVGLASGTGAANAPPPWAATGAAPAASAAGDAPNAGQGQPPAASGTGAAQPPTVTAVSAPVAGLASGAGTAPASSMAAAGLASGAGAAPASGMAQALLGSGTGAAQSAAAALAVTVAAGQASGAGAAPASGMAQASAASAPGTAQPVTVTSAAAPVASLASGAGTAPASGMAQAIAAAGTATAQSAAVASAAAPAAGLAAGAGAAPASSMAQAGPGSGTGTAQQATVTSVPSVSATAGLAPGAGTAPASGMAQAGLPPVAGAAQQPSVPVAAGLASGAGAAAPTAFIYVPAGLASGAGAAAPVTAATATSGTANAALASGTGTAQQASIPVPAGLASATGTAQPASVPATAGPAAGTGTAQQPAVAAVSAPSAALASGTGTAQQPSVPATAGLASGTGAAPQASVPVTAVLASAAGTSQQPSVSASGSTVATAGLAPAAGAAPQASVPVPAGLASGTGAAFQPSVQVNAGLATATGTAQQPSVSASGSTSAPAGPATGTGTAQPAGGGTVLVSSADSAHATESAFYYITGTGDTAAGAEGGAVMAVRSADKASAVDVPLSAWPGSHDAARAVDRAASAWPTGEDIGRASESYGPFRFTGADAASGTEVLHEMGIWTYVPANVHLLGGHWRITGLDEHGREVTVAQGERLTGAVLRLAEQVSWSRVTVRVTSADSVSMAEAAGPLVGVTCWVTAAVQVTCWVEG